MIVLRSAARNDTTLAETPEPVPTTEVVRRWRSLTAVVLTVLAGGLVVISSDLVRSPTGRLVADLTTLTAAVAASAAFAVTARRGPATQRRWRLLIAAAVAVWALGQALWTWRRAAGGDPMPFPDIANACFLVLPVCAFVALLRLARRDRAAAVTRTPRRAVVLDAVIIVFSAVALTWKTVFAPVAGHERQPELLLADGYTVADLALIVVVLLLAVTLRSMWRVPMVLITVALIAIGVSDTMYMYAINSAGPPPGVADAGYMTGPALLLLAAIVPDRRFSRSRPQLVLWGLPYVPLLAVCAFVVGTTATREHAHPVEIYFLGVIVVLVVVRQLLTQRQVHQAHRQLTFQATHDPLTGMANRSLLLDALSRALRKTGGTERPGIFFLDVDRFKELNDTLGHRSGDTVLRTIAGRLRTNVRDTDTIARLGGDEFVLLVDPAPQRPQHLANRLAAAVREPVALEGRSELYHPSASIGYVRLEADDTPDHALARADAAMYRAKRTRSRTYTGS